MPLLCFQPCGEYSFVQKTTVWQWLRQFTAKRDLNITDVRILPDIVMALDVDFVKDPFWGLQEILFHLHSYVPGQQTH